jgi:hypothetical protein
MELVRFMSMVSVNHFLHRGSFFFSILGNSGLLSFVFLN